MLAKLFSESSGARGPRRDWVDGRRWRAYAHILPAASGLPKGRRSLCVLSPGEPQFAHLQPDCVLRPCR